MRMGYMLSTSVTVGSLLEIVNMSIKFNKHNTLIYIYIYIYSLNSRLVLLWPSGSAAFGGGKKNWGAFSAPNGPKTSARP